MHIVRAFSATEAAAVVAAAAASTAWRDAGINENLEVDRSVRDAEVLFEADNAALIELCRERLFSATRNIAAVVATGTVLAEIQIVRYQRRRKVRRAPGFAGPRRHAARTLARVLSER